MKDLKNNKSLTNSKSEVRCEDHLIHLLTKLKNILRLNQDHKEEHFCKRVKIEIVLIIYQYKFIFANHISFQLFDFLQLGNFVFTNFWHARWDHIYLSSLLHQLVTSFEVIWLKEHSNQKSSFWKK